MSFFLHIFASSIVYQYCFPGYLASLKKKAKRLCHHYESKSGAYFTFDVLPGFKPPTLKDKTRWSANFHHFVKVALTKNPKKRPSADRLLLHPFVTLRELSKRLMRELMERVNNPHQFSLHGMNGHHELDPEDELVIADVPQRISSKRSVRSKEKTRSELHMESINFEVPLLTELSSINAEVHRWLQGTTNLSVAWGLHDQNSSAGVTEQAREEPESFDLATSWMEGENSHDKEDIEYSTPPSTPKTNGNNEDSAYASSANSNKVETQTSNSVTSVINDSTTQDSQAESISDTPPEAPPRRRDRHRRVNTSPPRTATNGLPPTPKVIIFFGENTILWYDIIYPLHLSILKIRVKRLNEKSI